MSESDYLLSRQGQASQPSGQWRTLRVNELFKLKSEIQAIGDEKDGAEPSLKRSVNLAELIGFGVACTVGSGIYALVGLGAAKAGPAVALSYLIGAISCVFTGFAYSEFASRLPIAGSAYTYIYTTFGEMFAWFIGWNLTLEYAIGSAVVARSWMAYLRVLFKQFHVILPSWLDSIPMGSFANGNLVAAVLILVAHWESLQVNLGLTALNIAILIFFIIAGSFHFSTSNWLVIRGSFIPFGVGSVFSAAGMVFFAYLGFDMVSSLAEEVQKPRRDLPIGIIGSLGISGGLYIVVALIVTGMLPFPMLDQSAPLTQAFSYHHQHWQAKIVAIAAVIGLGATTLTGLMGQPRIFYRMAKDGLFFPFFAGDGGQIPWIGTVTTGVITALIAFFIPEDILANAISIGTLTAFSLVDAAVVVVRMRTPTHPHRSLVLVLLYTGLAFLASVLLAYAHTWGRWAMYSAAVLGVLALVILAVLCMQPQPPSLALAKGFQTPLVPIIPCVGILINVNMMAGLDVQAWIRLAVWTFIGAAIYFLYGYHHSKLRTPNAAMKETGVAGDT